MTVVSLPVPSLLPIFVGNAYSRPPEALRLGNLMNTAGLVGYWAFDEGSGTTAADVMGNNDGTLTNFDLTTAGWETSTIEKTGDSTATNDPLAVWNPTQIYTKAGIMFQADGISDRSWSIRLFFLDFFHFFSSRYWKFLLLFFVLL